MSAIRLGDTEPIGALFLDETGAGVTGLSPVVVIRRAADGTFWDGAAYQATPTNLALAEVSAANAPGEYQYDFTPGSAGKHFWTVFAAAGGPPYPANVVGPVQPGEVDVGGWVDGVDLLRKLQSNRCVVNAAGTLVTVYEDDDVTPAFTLTVTADRLERSRAT